MIEKTFISIKMTNFVPKEINQTEWKILKK